MVGIGSHDVPNDRAIADRDHGLGADLRLLSQSRAKAAAEDEDRNVRVAAVHRYLPRVIAVAPFESLIDPRISSIIADRSAENQYQLSPLLRPEPPWSGRQLAAASLEPVRQCTVFTGGHSTAAYSMGRSLAKCQEANLMRLFVARNNPMIGPVLESAGHRAMCCCKTLIRLLAIVRSSRSLESQPRGRQTGALADGTKHRVPPFRVLHTADKPARGLRFEIAPYPPPRSPSCFRSGHRREGSIQTEQVSAT